MQRIQEHRLALGRIIRDDRTGGDNRLVAELCALLLDAKLPRRKKNQPQYTPEEIEESKRDQELFELLIRSRFTNKRGDIRKHSDYEEDAPPISKVEKEATELERKAIDALLRRG